MAKIWLAGLAVALVNAAGSALAADVAPAPLSYKAPPPAPAQWTGFYLNAGGGYGLWNADTAVAPPGFTISTNTEGGAGWFGTIGGGYDYQIGDRAVVGLLADFNFANIKGTFSDPSEAISGTMTEQHSWAAGARLGFLVTPELLAYVNGGFTQAHFSGVDFVGNQTLVFPLFGTPVSTMAPHTYSGWFVGGGAETTLPVLGPGWFLRSEYRFSDYNTASLSNVLLPALGGTVVDIQQIHPYVQTISTSLIYKFNSALAGPSTASIGSFISTAFDPAPARTPWNGFYVGAGGGVGFWNVDTADVPGGVPGNPGFFTGTGTEGGRGGFGTLSAGYDYQVTRRIVLGAFADFDFGDMSGVWQDEGGFVSGTLKESRAWAVGPRVGWLVTPQILSYVNGGFTQAHFDPVNIAFDHAPIIGVPFATMAAQDYDGAFLGGGVEAALPFAGNGWFARAEYRYAQYKSANIAEVLVPPLAGVADVVSIRPDVQSFRAELIYKFNWTSTPPLVTKD